MSNISDCFNGKQKYEAKNTLYLEILFEKDRRANKTCEHKIYF